MYIIKVTLIYWGNDLRVAHMQSCQIQLYFVLPLPLGCDFSELDIFPVRIGIVTINVDSCAWQALKIWF